MKIGNHIIERFVVRLRGLPLSARDKEIIDFFEDEEIKEIQIVFLTNGRASGMLCNPYLVFFIPF